MIACQGIPLVTLTICWMIAVFRWTLIISAAPILQKFCMSHLVAVRVIIPILTAVAVMLLIESRLERVFFWYQEDLTRPMKRLRRLRLPGRLSSEFSFCFIYSESILTLYFRARKSAEVHSFVLLCQLPVPRASAVQGHVAVDLDYFTSFGQWICDMIVLHTHQKVSKFSEYQDQPADVPLAAFQFLENLAISFRPHVHPDYYQSLM